MKIHILHCGSISLSKSALEASGSSAADTAKQILASDKQRVTMPVAAYLIEHPRGPVLVDTGWCRDISPNGVYDAKAARSVLGPALASFYRPQIGEGQTVDEQLKKLGIRTSELEAVLLTHLDADHVAGLKHVADAKRIILPEDEYFWSCRTVYKLRQPWKLWQSYPIERIYYRGFPDVPNNWAFDVFGDGTVYMVNLPGHTDGMAGIVVVSGRRFVLLCADAAFNSSSWENLTVPGFGFDRDLQLKCLKWIRDMSRRPGCAAVLASHDAAVSPGVIEI